MLFFWKVAYFLAGFIVSLFINKTLRPNNLKTRTAVNAKVSVFVICVEAIVYLLLYNFHDCTFNIFYLSHQGSFISDMEWAPKCLFWNVNDSIVKLMVSIASGVSLRYRACYRNMLNYDNDNKYRKLTTI